MRAVNVFPSAIENIGRRFPEVDEFRTEVHSQRGRDELRCDVETVPAGTRRVWS